MTTDRITITTQDEQPSTGDNGQPVETAPSGSADIAPQVSTTDVAPDPFDPESLRLGQDFGATIGVKKVLTTVPCRKPNRHEFV